MARIAVEEGRYHGPVVYDLKRGRVRLLRNVDQWEAPCACRVLLKNVATQRVVPEPLPRVEIVKDLVVDVDSFWENYEQIRLWLHARIADAQESRVSRS